jgi:dTDP-glucose pyrophosphorylase
LLAQPVDAPEQFGIAFLKPDGFLEKLVEKPKIPGPQLANAGAYKFPRSVFDIELTLSPRGEFEITEYVSKLALRQGVHVMRAKFWLPMGTVEVWQAAQTMDLESILTANRT